VALKLARALDNKVEDLFFLEDDGLQPLPTEQVELLSGEDVPVPGQPLQLCRVNKRVIAASPEPGTWSLPAGDAVLMGAPANTKAPQRVRAQVIDLDWKERQRLLIAGCDPAATLLARHLERHGVELVVAFQNSSRALELLKRGLIHIAGTHLSTDASTSGGARADRVFAGGSFAVLSFALWEEGLVVAPGNPKSIHSPADLVREEVSIANREAGAGCRTLLDSLLQRLGIQSSQVRGYDRIAPGHLPAARLVQAGLADCCISTRAAARFFGLDFVPLVTKRYDLVVRKSSLKLPQMEILLETLGRTPFRRSIEAIAGYDMKTAGERVV
jgi:molybdate-binding protein